MRRTQRAAAATDLSLATKSDITRGRGVLGATAGLSLADRRLGPQVFYNEERPPECERCL